VLVGLAIAPAGGHGHGGIGPLLHWQLMVLAIMLPFARESVRATAALSFRRRRHRAIGGFLVGFLGLWLAAGLVMTAAAGALTPGAQRPGGVVVGLALLAAAAWQPSAARRRAMAACHRTMPLAPRGWRADRDCVVFGWTIGTGCVRSCWPLALACALAHHHLAVMAACGLLGAAERLTPRPNQRLLGGAVAGLAVASVLLTALG